MKRFIVTTLICALLLLSGCSSKSETTTLTPIGEDKAVELVEELYPLSSPFFTNVKVSQFSNMTGDKYKVTFDLRGHSYEYNVSVYSGDVQYVAVI